MMEAAAVVGVTTALLSCQRRPNAESLGGDEGQSREAPTLVRLAEWKVSNFEMCLIA